MDKERLERIKDKYMEHEYDYALSSMDIDWLISTVEDQRREIERLNGVISVMDGNLVRNGREIMKKEDERADLQYKIDEQQKEIERLDNEMDGLLTIVEDRNPKAHDLFIKLKQENSKLRKALEGVLKYRHVDEG